MRVLLDANVLISYLLPSRQASAVAVVVEKALSGEFVALVPAEMLAELADAIARKPYLSNRIEPETVQTLVEALAGVAEVVPTIAEPIPAVSRDPKDDYLLAYALVGRADYLVSGDDDLLAVRELADVRIVRPAELLAIVEDSATKEP